MDEREEVRATIIVLTEALRELGRKWQAAHADTKFHPGKWGESCQHCADIALAGKVLANLPEAVAERLAQDEAQDILLAKEMTRSNNMREVLQAVEWVQAEGAPVLRCLHCGGDKPAGHAADCALKKALG